MCPAFQAVQHKPYEDLQSLPVPTYHWKNVFIDFVTSLLLFADWKGDSYDSILVIVNHLTKIVYYKLDKVTINAPKLAKVIIKIVVQYYDLLSSFISDCKAIFTFNFWSLLYYFFGIKRQLSNAFHPQTNKQTKKQNSIIKAYFCAFINWE